MGVNILKRTKDAKVKVFSKDYIWNMAFLCWFIFLCFAFFIPILQVHCARYKIIFITSFILCIQVLNNIKMNNFCWKHIFKTHNFIKNTFEINVFKCVLKWIWPTSSAFVFLIINIKILSNFENEWCTFDNEKGCLKKKKKKCP
jgi:hypothetical protein